MKKKISAFVIMLLFSGFVFCLNQQQDPADYRKQQVQYVKCRFAIFHWFFPFAVSIFTNIIASGLPEHYRSIP